MSLETGLGRMEAAAALDMAIVATERSAEAASLAKAEAIETRIVSGDVQLLNDATEAALYGSREINGVRVSTFYDADGVEIPVGQGTLSEMREEPAVMKGRPMAERNVAKAQRDKEAKKYEGDIMKLVENDGYELCQAKMIVDMRRDDKEGTEALAAKMEANTGLTADEAMKKAEKVYKAKDGQRLKLIKEGGAFTPDEYDAVRNGEDLYDEDHIKARSGEAEEEIVVPPPTEAVKTHELVAAESHLVEARKNLAEVRAGRESRVFHTGEYTNDELQRSLAHYEKAKFDAGVEAALAINEAKAQGLEISDEETRTLINIASLQEARQVTQEQFNIEMSGATDTKLLKVYKAFGGKKRHEKNITDKGNKRFADIHEKISEAEVQEDVFDASRLSDENYRQDTQEKVKKNRVKAGVAAGTLAVTGLLVGFGAHELISNNAHEMHASGKVVDSHGLEELKFDVRTDKWGDDEWKLFDNLYDNIKRFPKRTAHYFSRTRY